MLAFSTVRNIVSRHTIRKTGRKLVYRKLIKEERKLIKEERKRQKEQQASAVRKR